MTGQPWRVRVESKVGNVLGTGFLLDSTRVMTCAHVVKDKQAVLLTFPEHAEIGAVPATAEFVGPWSADSDLGDVAVLVLDRNVGVEAVRFARLDALAERRLDPTAGELHVYGFPRGYDREGADTAVRARYMSLHQGEWAQLEAVEAHGIRLQSGFSGAAVTFADTGEVVGMVVGADRNPDTKTGKMLPLARISQYWEPISDLLPFGQLPAAVGAELRELLAKVRIDIPVERVYEASLPGGLGPAAPEFRSLWDVARFLASEVADDGGQPLARFCMTVAFLVDDPAVRAALEDWRGRHLADAATSVAVGVSNLQTGTHGSVLVRLAAAGVPHTFNLTIATVIGSIVRTVYQGAVHKGEVRRQVERRLMEAIRQIPATLGVWVEFELPRTWLTQPVDEWHADPTLRYPVGWSYPVVVRDLPPTGVSDRPRQLRSRWKTLTARPVPPLDTIDCRDARDHRALAAWLVSSAERTVLVLANPPKRPDKHAALRAALYAGVPVMLWTRQACTDDHAEQMACAGDRFLRTIDEALATVRPDELPQAVRTLRASAAQTGKDDEHCGRALTLFWDDPQARQHLDTPLGFAV